MSRLYVGNLPDSVTEKALEEFFRAARHPVEGIQLIRDVDTGLPRGFAFVDLAPVAVVRKAIRDLKWRSLAGKSLVLDEARPQAQTRGGAGRRFEARPRQVGRGGGRGRGGARQGY